MRGAMRIPPRPTINLSGNGYAGPFTDEQRIRIEGACLAKLLRLGMTIEEIREAAQLAIIATKELEHARRGRR